MMRVVKKDFFDVHGNKLTAVGDIYIWGRADWNPWAPSFAGDDGLYLNDLGGLLRSTAEAYGRPQQVQFHVFRQCTLKEHIDLPYSAWHGQRAAGKTIYCGLYAIPDDEPPQAILFKDFPNYTQSAHARLCWKRRNSTTAEQTEAQVAAEEHFLLEKPALKDDSSRWHPTSSHIGGMVTIFKSGDIKLPGMELPYPTSWIGTEPAKARTIQDEIVSVEPYVGGAVVLLSGLKFLNPRYQYPMFPVKYMDYSEEVYSELDRIRADNGVVETDVDKLGTL